jgi:hypothetical protein
MKEFADLQKRPEKERPEKAPDLLLRKLLTPDRFFPKPKKKVAGYGPGGYGKTALGLRKFSVYELATGVRPETLIEQAAASSGSEELTGQRDTRTAQVSQDDVKQSQSTDVGFQQSEEPSPTPLQPEPIQVASAALTPGMLAQPQSGSLLPAAHNAPEPVQLNAVAAPVLMAQTIPFPTGGFPLLRGVPLPKIPAVPPWVIPWVTPGISPFELLPGAGSKELEWERQNRARQRFGTPQPTAPSIPSPRPSKPGVSVPVAPVQQEPKPQSQQPLQNFEQQQAWEQEQREWRQERQKQEDLFQAQQAAQTKLWAKQEKLDRLSAGFILNQEHVASFEAQLTPSQKGALTKEVNERYKALTGLAQQADNKIEPYQVAELQQKIRQQVLYERFVPVREIYHFGNQFLNGYTPQKMKAVRGYFDQVFEGKYAKSIPADKRAAILKSADARYTEETGKKPNREDILWKTLRNVEASEKYPDLWTQFRDNLNSADNGVMQTVVGSKDPNLGSNALNRPDQKPPLNIPTHTGHAPSKEKFDPNAINQSGNAPALNLPNHTGHTNAEKPAVTNVFEYTTDYRDNYEKVHGPIPKGYQIHHIAPRAVFNKSPLTQEWVKRGLTKLDYPENLEALPQTQDAYDKSSTKIQHSGSHPEWSDHAEDTFDNAQKKLTDQYGSLDKVPDDVMKQTKDSVMQELREDLLDKDLGIEKGWVVPKKSGMDKLSQAQDLDQIG